MSSLLDILSLKCLRHPGGNTELAPGPATDF